jgi:putative exosortase-associated protein (TIGR04073 family)
MSKTLIAIAIVSLFILSGVGAYAVESTGSSIDQPTIKPGMEKTKDRLNRGVNNIFYGPVEVPNNLNQTQTKGAQMDRCSAKTRTGVERGIARVVTGVWQIATFWYSDPGCVTSSKKTAGGKEAQTFSSEIK